jgi:hypothetical protein
MYLQKGKPPLNPSDLKDNWVASQASAVAEQIAKRMKQLGLDDCQEESSAGAEENEHRPKASETLQYRLKLFLW